VRKTCFSTTITTVATRYTMSIEHHDHHHQDLLVPSVVFGLPPSPPVNVNFDLALMLLLLPEMVIGDMVGEGLTATLVLALLPAPPPPPMIASTLFGICENDDDDDVGSSSGVGG